MEYNVYLEYQIQLDLNFEDHFGGVYEHNFADIMYELTEVPENEEIEYIVSDKILLDLYKY